jgi:hypothetical protein
LIPIRAALKRSSNELNFKILDPKTLGVGAACSALHREGRTIWVAGAHRGDGKRFIVRADEKLTAFVELERQVLTVTFYLASIREDSCGDQ